MARDVNEHDVDVQRAADAVAADQLRAMLDLDHFKLVNDTYGHAAGDVVLKSVARRLRNSLKADDVLARLGGD